MFGEFTYKEKLGVASRERLVHRKFHGFHYFKIFLSKMEEKTARMYTEGKVPVDRKQLMMHKRERRKAAAMPLSTRKWMGSRASMWALASDRRQSFSRNVQEGRVHRRCCDGIMRKFSNCLRFLMK